MELDSDLNKLRGPESFLRRQQKRLLIIDEVQRKPELFKILRGLIDIHKRAGESSGQFLLLGSASRDLLQQSSETLAGRIRYMELCPFSAAEIYNSDPLGYNNDKLWFRGGFPGSYLAENDNESWQWRADFISTYVERDIPLMGPKVSAMRLKRFWTMLAHYQGQQVVTSDLGKSLGVSHTTIKSYMDILTDFYMIRQIQPWSGNSKKDWLRPLKHIYATLDFCIACLIFQILKVFWGIQL
nr:AAA family ATPase [Arachidicoccus ginsenosidivorans]